MTVTDKHSRHIYNFTRVLPLTVYGIAADIIAVNSRDEDLPFVVVNEETPDHDEWFGEYQSSRSNLGAGQSLMRVDSKMAKRILA